MRRNTDGEGSLLAVSYTHLDVYKRQVECYAMSGDMDYLLRIQVADLAHFSKFAMDTLMRHPAVVDMRSFFALQQIKETTELRL